MSNVDHRELGRRLRVVAGVGLLAMLLVGCSHDSSVEVRAGTASPAPKAAPAEPGEKFQGSITTVDADRNGFGMAVSIVWTPAVKAIDEERQVVVGPQTTWPPGGGGVAQLRTGEDVQVDAVARPDGTWEARRIQFFDLE